MSEQLSKRNSTLISEHFKMLCLLQKREEVISVNRFVLQQIIGLKLRKWLLNMFS